MDKRVFIRYKEDLQYPTESPFHPSESFPEFSHIDISENPNNVYQLLRELFRDAGYDKENYNTSAWNPLKEYITPGQTVLIKPNWVRDYHPDQADITSLITHSSLIRAMVDYAALALKRQGKIIIGDAPVQNTNFQRLMERSGMIALSKYFNEQYPGLVEIKDFRKEITVREKSVVLQRTIRDDAEFTEVNFGEKSYLHEIRHDFKKFRVTNYDATKMQRYHNLKDHIYLIDRSILQADTIIYLPKLKTHRKAGITCCMKNSVGINVQKDCLVHHRKGSVKQGGDAYLYFNIFKHWKENLTEKFDKTVSISAQKRIRKILKYLDYLILLFHRDPYFEGSWYGNNSLWRMILDLTALLFYADKNGHIQETQQRKILYIVDAVLAGEKEGPLHPSDVHLGALVLGSNPVIVDWACSRLIGFDYSKMPVIQKALTHKLLETFPELYKEKLISFNETIYTLNELPILKRLTPSLGWKGHIELNI